MPQHLNLEVDGVLTGRISTSNKGGTLYDVCWFRPDGGLELSLTDVDTGVPRQPQTPDAMERDFKNDFTHSKRAIAAATKTATRFLFELPKALTERPLGSGRVVIRLRTNKFDRGVNDLQPVQGDRVDVRVRIGTGPNRPHGALPKEVVEFTQEGIDVVDVTSSVALVLQVFASVGPSLLEQLSELEQHA